MITLGNWEHRRRHQIHRAAEFRELCKKLGIPVLTTLNAEQLAEDKRDEALMWPARWW
jgi:hypothetical protein